MRGSVVKRGNGYSYVLSLGRDENGRKRQKWVSGFRTKREAEAALVAALERVRTGRWADPGSTTVAEFCGRWLDAIGPTLRPATVHSYSDVLRNYVQPRIGTVKLAVLDGGHLATLHADLLRDGRRRGRGGLLTRTVAYVHRVLKHALRDAVRWGLLASNPADLVAPPRVVRHEMQAWTPAQARTFLRSLRGDRLEAMWVLFVSSGLRRGEVLGLRWSDIDLDRGVLAVRQTYVVVGGGVAEFGEPKTTKGRRTVSLDPDTVNALRVHRLRQLEERLLVGPEWHDLGLVFTAGDGQPLHPNRVTAMFKRRAVEAALPPMRLHDLRHTAATLALAAGVHPKVVSERLGHSAIAITLDIYSHVIDNMQADAANRIGDLLFNVDDDEGHGEPFDDDGEATGSDA